MTAHNDLKLAIGHLKAAKTKIFAARYDHGRISSATDDLLRSEAREIYKIEQRLYARCAALLAEADARFEAEEAARDQARSPPSKPKRSAPRRAA